MSVGEPKKPSVVSIKNKILHEFRTGDTITPETIISMMNCPVPFNPKETLRFLAEHDGIIESTGNPANPDEYRVVIQKVTVRTLPTKAKTREERTLCQCPHCEGKRLCDCPECKKKKNICTVCLGMGYCYTSNEPLIDFPLLSILL